MPRGQDEGETVGPGAGQGRHGEGGDGGAACRGEEEVPRVPGATQDRTRDCRGGKEVYPFHMILIHQVNVQAL